MSNVKVTADTRTHTHSRPSRRRSLPRRRWGVQVHFIYHYIKQ